MNGDRRTKTVVRALLPWADTEQQRWLEEQARSGWHLKAVRCFGYVFERGAPAKVAYRLDFGPSVRGDRAEYLGLFRDAGWEHVGCRGLWQVFRRAAGDGAAPEIYTDTGSRIAMYRQVVLVMTAMLVVLATQIGPRIASDGPSSGIARYPAVFAFQLLLAAVFAYGIVRLLLVIARLRRTGAREASH